jgi:hypothetical protein
MCKGHKKEKGTKMNMDRKEQDAATKREIALDLPGIDLSGEKGTQFWRDQHLSTRFECVALLFPANYINTMHRLPSPMADASLFGTLCEDRGFQVFHFRNPTISDWLRWLDYFSQNTYQQLIVFFDGHGIIKDGLEPSILCFPKTKAQSYHSSLVTPENLLNGKTIVQHLDWFQQDTCRVTLVVDCCHAGAIFNSTVVGEPLPKHRHFLLASAQDQAAHYSVLHQDTPLTPLQNQDQFFGAFSFFLVHILKRESAINLQLLLQRLQPLLQPHKQTAVIISSAIHELFFPRSCASVLPQLQPHFDPAILHPASIVPVRIV